MISFSKRVKEELLIQDEQEVKVALSAIILSIGSLQFWEDEILFEIKSSNITLIRKTITFLRYINKNLDEKIIIRENKKFKKNNKLFIISIENKAKELLTELDLIDSNNINIFTTFKIPKYINAENEKNINVFLKYLFICNASINDPKVRQQYHLEIIFNNNIALKTAQEFAKKYDINFKVTTRKSISALYLNKGEEIADFLKLIGCIKTMFDFEDQRLMRDIRATENRLINAEVANEAKKNEVALKQINAIKTLKKHNRYELLKDKTKLIAKARESNPQASLNELFDILSGEISKSNIRYHLNLLIKESEYMS